MGWLIPPILDIHPLQLILARLLPNYILHSNTAQGINAISHQLSASAGDVF